MGVVTGLLLLPITGPLRAFRFLLERLHDEAEAVLRDEGRAFAELIDLSMRHNAGQLTEAEYIEQEAHLLERLNSIRDYRNELLHADAYEDEEEWYDDPDAETDEWCAVPDADDERYGEPAADEEEW
jgi:hypothetical protein